MKGIGERSGAYLYSTGYGPINPPPDYVNFSEDDQAFYVAQLDIDETNGPRWNPDPRADELIPYITEDIGLAEWGINHFIAPYNSNKHWTATYRTCCTNRFRAGYVLGAIMMNAKELWNNDALFDYQERYMEVTSDSGEFPGYRQADIFTEEIWDTYHNPDAPDCTLDTDCNDDLYCNGTELCLAGKCSTGTNPCSEDTYTCTTTTCNDTTDSCDISYDNTVCDDSDVCTDDVCIGSLGDVTTGCQITNNTASCNDGNTCTENDTCWHIEYEGNNAVIEGWQHIWLYSSLDFSRIDSVSFLVKPNPFGDFDNNEWEFHFNYLDIEDDQENRYFLVMQYDQVGLQRQLGEVFEEYEYVDYTFTEEGNWYDVRIEFDDVLGTVVYIDDEMVLSDQTNKPEYEGATVSLETLDDSATWIDDLVIVGETYSQIYTL